jgi:hypothetical protein
VDVTFSEPLDRFMSVLRDGHLVTFGNKQPAQGGEDAFVIVNE